MSELASTQEHNIDDTQKIIGLNKEDLVEKTGTATMAGKRHKVALKPGHSHMDWMRLTKSGIDLSGTGGQMLKISRGELEKHNTRDDMWIVLRGKVYNATKYLDFHPGGVDELMRGAGKDATRLFEYKHAWVNFESMLQQCFVGILVQDK